MDTPTSTLPTSPRHGGTAWPSVPLSTASGQISCKLSPSSNRRGFGKGEVTENWFEAQIEILIEFAGLSRALF